MYTNCVFVCVCVVYIMCSATCSGEATSGISTTNDQLQSIQEESVCLFVLFVVYEHDFVFSATESRRKEWTVLIVD